MNINDLVHIFSEHEVTAEENNLQCLREFIKNNPEAEIPDYMKTENFFNLATALKTMCKEIVAIKEKLGMHKSHAKEII